MNIKGPKGRGAYSAIVYKDGDVIVAEDDVGTIIDEGANAATVINAAVDSLPTNGGLIFLKDKFAIDATITIDSTGVILMGDSWANSGLSTSADISLITITPAASKTIIEKLYLEGANDVAKTNNHGIYFSGSTEKYDSQLRDLYIVHTYDGIKGYKVHYMYLDNVRTNLCTHDGIHLTGAVTSYSSVIATNISMKSYGNVGFYGDYLMGCKIVNAWLEGDYVGVHGLYVNAGFMNWYSNIDCEGNTGDGARFENDVFGSSIIGGWFSGNEGNGLLCYGSKQVTISQCYFSENDYMGVYLNDSERIILQNCYAVENSKTGAGSHSGLSLNDSVNCILEGNNSYDAQGTKTQDYGIREFGTCDYNTFKNNNLRGNLTAGIATIGAHNTYDLNHKSTIFDLSGSASDIEVFHAIAPCILVGYQILYTEASSSDAGVNIRIGRYQSGVALDDDYFDISTSEVSKSKGYSKFFKTSDLTQKVIAVGDTITVGTAGGKTGTGNVFLILLIAEQAD